MTTTTEQSVTVGTALHDAAQRLGAARVDAPRLVAEVLLAQTLNVGRAQLLGRLEQTLALEQIDGFQTLVRRSESGEPLAYIQGHREFYALDFLVDPRVLIPRPETELLIETAILIARARPESRTGEYRIADVGTGSGVIAVTLAVHLPFARIVATDISPDAVAVAAENACRHGVSDRIEFRVGDLLAPVDAPIDLLAANLPYVRSKEWQHLALSIRGHEPAIAFNGGTDGLHLVSRLLRAAPRVVRPGGSLLLEVGAAHGEASIELARDCFPQAHIAVAADYAGRDRLLVIQMPAP